MNLDIENFDMKNDRIETTIMKDMQSYNYTILDKILINIFNECNDWYNNEENENIVQL